MAGSVGCHITLLMASDGQPVQENDRFDGGPKQMIPGEHKQGATKAPTEGIAQTIGNLIDAAYESFTQGEITSAQLEDLYRIIGNWTKASEQVYETMNKFGIRA